MSKLNLWEGSLNILLDVGLSALLMLIILFSVCVGLICLSLCCVLWLVSHPARRKKWYKLWWENVLEKTSKIVIFPFIIALMPLTAIALHEIEDDR